MKHEIWQVQNTRHAVVSAGQSHTRLRFRNIRKPQVAFLSAVLLFMSIFLSWIKQQDLSVIILFKKALHSEPQHDL